MIAREVVRIYIFSWTVYDVNISLEKLIIYNLNPTLVTTTITTP